MTLLQIGFITTSVRYVTAPNLSFDAEVLNLNRAQWPDESIKANMIKESVVWVHVS